MTPLELAGLKALRASLDALITAAEGAKPRFDPEVQAKLDIASEADDIIAHWERLTGCKASHVLVSAWVQEHGRIAVRETINKMLTKNAKEAMEHAYQRNWVAKVLAVKAENDALQRKAPTDAIKI